MTQTVAVFGTYVLRYTDRAKMGVIVLGQAVSLLLFVWSPTHPPARRFPLRPVFVLDARNVASRQVQASPPETQRVYSTHVTSCDM